MVTLAELKLQSRQRADMVNNLFVTDSELTSYINASLAELHDLLTASFNDDYAIEEYLFNSNGLDLDFDLPVDFYKLRGVDVRNGSGQWSTVKRFNFNRRNESQNSFAYNLLGLPYLEYRLIGNKIRFNRTPDNNTNFRLWYNPRVTQLVLDTDSYDDINGFAEYVVVDAAIKMMQKEESDVTVLLAQKQALKDRIQAMAANRDANEPASITDIQAEDTDLVVFTRG